MQLLAHADSIGNKLHYFNCYLERMNYANDPVGVGGYLYQLNMLCVNTREHTLHPDLSTTLA
jgi:hypothetical protein